MEPMDDGSVAILMCMELTKAVDKFEAEFDSSKVETMIHRFPAGLGDGMRIRYPYMVVPRFVAIGPYHHGKKRLEKMEEVKEAAVYCLFDCIETEPHEARKAVFAVVNKCRARYRIADIETAYFADMMFRDACFLLLYMYFDNRSNSGNEGVNESMRRFLFSNRDSIDNDIMLLENQLPWLVIQVLMREDKKNVLRVAVRNFIANMGDSFKIRQDLIENHGGTGSHNVWDDEDNPPAHLLALLRRYKTENTSESSVGNSNHHLYEPLIQPTPQPPKSPEITSISSMSPVNLEEIGIKLAASKTEKFSNMGMEKGRWLWSHLTLAPLSLSNARASCLVNMAAFEVCTASSFGDDPDRTAVCSYLAFLAFFMVGREDVHKLQSKGLLHGPHSDDDMLAFFKTVVQHLPDGGKRFSFVMRDIEKYRKNSPIRNTLYKWLYNNYGNIIKVVTVLGTLTALYRALLSLVQKE